MGCRTRLFTKAVRVILLFFEWYFCSIFLQKNIWRGWKINLVLKFVIFLCKNVNNDLLINILFLVIVLNETDYRSLQ